MAYNEKLASKIIDAEADEIERLLGLLREAAPFVNDVACFDENPETQSRANDLFVRISAVLQ